jgi:hypothetical protein
MENRYKISMAVMLLMSSGFVCAAEPQGTEGVHSAHWLQEEISCLVDQIEELDLAQSSRENSALRARLAAKRGSYVRLLGEQRSGNDSGRRSSTSSPRKSVSFSPNQDQFCIIPNNEQVSAGTVRVPSLPCLPSRSVSRSLSSLLPGLNEPNAEEDISYEPSFERVVRVGSAVTVSASVGSVRQSATSRAPLAFAGAGFGLRKSLVAPLQKLVPTTSVTPVVAPLRVAFNGSTPGRKPGAFHLPLLPKTQ